MRLEDIRGLETSGDCYLVGNGDNLDVNKLTRFPSFATNLINRIYHATNWRPTYYVCTDKVVLDNYKDEVIENIRASKHSFLPEEALPMYNYDNVIPIIVKHDPFDDEITEGIYSPGTTLFTALKIAQWIGYDSVTFAGCNLYFGKELHFYPRRDDIMAKLPPDELSRRKLRSIQAHFWMIVYANKNKLRVRYI